MHQQTVEEGDVFSQYDSISTYNKIIESLKIGLEDTQGIWLGLGMQPKRHTEDSWWFKLLSQWFVSSNFVWFAFYFKLIFCFKFDYLLLLGEFFVVRWNFEFGLYIFALFFHPLHFEGVF